MRIFKNRQIFVGKGLPKILMTKFKVWAHTAVDYMIILRSIELGSGKLPPAPKLWEKCVHLVTEPQKHANPLASDKTFFNIFATYTLL